ncbi:MAG TPA: response regulator [Candidatus Dormibacteraeota bacterium]|nr:response regulator [Candidatus Dormibacteraeota bacterium]
MKKRLLVADDDPGIRASLARLLEQSGYAVTTAEDGAEAFRLLRLDEIDLLLLDLEMPKRDGWDVFQRLTASRSLLPIIIITGKAHELATRIIPGIAAIFEKPVEAAELLLKIQELLAEDDATRLRRLTLQRQQCLDSGRPTRLLPI